MSVSPCIRSIVPHQKLTPPICPLPLSIPYISTTLLLLTAYTSIHATNHTHISPHILQHTSTYGFQRTYQALVPSVPAAKLMTGLPWNNYTITLPDAPYYHPLIIYYPTLTLPPSYIVFCKPSLPNTHTPHTNTLISLHINKTPCLLYTLSDHNKLHDKEEQKDQTGAFYTRWQRWQLWGMLPADHRRTPLDPKLLLVLSLISIFILLTISLTHGHKHYLPRPTLPPSQSPPFCTHTYHITNLSHSYIAAHICPDKNCTLHRHHSGVHKPQKCWCHTPVETSTPPLPPPTQTPSPITSVDTGRVLTQRPHYYIVKARSKKLQSLSRRVVPRPRRHVVTQLLLSLSLLYLLSKQSPPSPDHWLPCQDTYYAPPHSSPMMSTNTMRQVHPSSSSLPKAHSSNDLGDGPPKAKPRSTPGQLPVPKRAQRRSKQRDVCTSRTITSFLTTSSSPPTSKESPPPPKPSSVPTPGWNQRHHASVTSSHNKHHLLFTTETFGLALSPPTISSLYQVLSNSPRDILSDPAALQRIMGPHLVQPALRKLSTDYNTIPPLGYCTPLVVDELLHGRASGSLLHPPSRSRLMDTLAYVSSRNIETEHNQVSKAMQKYSQQLQRNPDSDTLHSKHWMQAELLFPLLHSIDRTHPIWMQDSPLLTPFTDRWMPLASPGTRGTGHQPVELSISQLRTMADTETVHIGFANGHHFFTRNASDNLLAQIDWMLTNIADHILRYPPSSHPETSTMSPNIEIPCQLSVQSGNTILFIGDNHLKRIITHCKYTNSDILFEKVVSMFAAIPFLQYAHLPSPDHSGSIPATGFCSLYTLDYCHRSPDGILPPLIPSDRHSITSLIRHLLKSTRSKESKTSLNRMHKAILLPSPSLPAAHWPHLNLVAAWANTHNPTTIWHEDTKKIPSGWVQLTTLPVDSGPSNITRTTWTSQQLELLGNKRHIALRNHHYFPTSIDHSDLSFMIQTLASRTTDFIINKRRDHYLHAVPTDTNTLLTTLRANNTMPSTNSGQLSTPLSPVKAAPPPPSPVQPTIVSTARVCKRTLRFARDDGSDDPPSPTTAVHSLDHLPAHHPALVPVDFPDEACRPPSITQNRRPRQAHLKPIIPLLKPLPLPLTKLYTLKALEHATDPVLIGDATAPGSCYGAFAKRDIEPAEYITAYSDVRPGYTPIVHPTDRTSSNRDYYMSIKSGPHWYEADPFQFDSCLGRFFDEANTEEEENCLFVVENGVIWLQATKPIQRFEQFLTRYGHEYWCDIKWPLALLRIMYQKYSPTLQSAANRQALTKWENIISQKYQQDKIEKCKSYPSILKAATNGTSDHGPFIPRQVTSSCNRARKKAQQQHKRQVIAGEAAPLRPIPHLNTLPHMPPFIPRDWQFNFPLPTDDDGSPQLPNARLNIMSYSCQGGLFSTGNHLTSNIAEFLEHVTDLMLNYKVDIMWLNDARFTRGTIDGYLTTLHHNLPNCRVYQFPTRYVHTGSRTQSFNRMGGAIAIVTHAWHGYVSRSIPDPSGSGLINALDIKAGPYSIRTINVYLAPDSNTATPGPATILSRLTRYIQGSTSPPWAKRLSPADYQFGYTQTLINEKSKIHGSLTLLSGDFNSSIHHDPNKSLSPLNLWIRVNRLQAPLQPTLHSLPDYHTWMSPTERQKNTIIDHILHSKLPQNITLHQAGTVNSEITNTLSDHHPIWLSLALMDPFTIPHPFKRLPVYAHPDLDMHDEKEREQYNKYLTGRLSSSLSKKFRNPSGTTISAQAGANGLAVILAHSVLSVHAKQQGLNKAVKATLSLRCKTTRSKYKDCYSPHMRELQCYLYFYHNLLRLTFPGGRKQWTDPWTIDSYQRILTDCLRKWNKRHALIIKKIDHLSPAAQLPPPSHLEQKSFHSITRDYMMRQIKRIKDCLHGAKRQSMRAATNLQIKKIDQLKKKRDLGTEIQILTGREASQLELQSLPCPRNGQITDPAEVQQKLKTVFHEWHAIPQNLDPAAAILARNPNYWQHLLEYKENGRARPLCKGSNIPLELQDSIRRVCAKKIQPEVEEDIHRTINAVITFDEFNESLNSIHNGGAPGPSGVTANMIKAWSRPTRLLVYGHMEHIWRTRTTPKWFKDKNIKLAPKLAGNPELNNMRPISLYEVLRKAWTTIVGKRIHLAWHNHDVLHAHQYGYRLDKGCPMALFSVINEIEEANHTKTTKHVTFWDIKRAFDSIPRNLQKLAWVRLGVPADVAEWFVNLDDGGLSFVSTPFYHINKNLHTPDSIAGKNTHFSQAPDLAYKAERGIGQGESASSLMWTALYDILLEFIDPRNRHLHLAEKLIEYSDDDAKQANPSAYADDLATVTSGPNAEYMQQLQATWLSAFCAFAGLVIHPAKIRTTVLGTIPDKYKTLPITGPLSFENKTDLLIHDLNWCPISCPTLPFLESVKYLGVNLELRDASHSTSHDTVMQEIQEHLSHLLIQPGSPGPKIDYILFKLLPIVLTTAICANWTLKQYRAMDAPFTRAYRLLLAIPTKAPEYIIYAPTTEMGMGLTRFSNKAQIMKWEALTRCLAVGGAPAKSMNNFLDRLPHSTSNTSNLLRTLSPPTTAEGKISWPYRKRYTVRSLIEWFHEAGLNICCTIQDPRDRDDQPHTNQSIIDYAEGIHLWPSSLYDDESNADLHEVRLVATDGSFTIQPRGTYDILASEHDLRYCGEGSGAVVLIPPKYSEKNTHLPAPHALRVTLKRSAPGLSAFVWELAMQTIGLQLTKFLNPAHVVYTSDCTGAISKTNQALSTRNNQLINGRGSVFASGAHEFADTSYPRRIIHTFGHPEKDKSRRDNPTLRDKGITMADAAAAGEEAKLGNRTFPLQIDELQLDDLFAEILPPGQWHLRTDETKSFPVVGDILPFHHRAEHKRYCTKRDMNNDCSRWSSTSFSFGNQVHPLRNTSYWTAARRALIAYDWIGHGRNRAKPHNNHTTEAERTQTSKCSQCGEIDSQGHCMLDCQHPSLKKIRIEARTTQGEKAVQLLAKHTDKRLKYLIKQFVHASWVSSPSTTRIWLGLWNLDTLRECTYQSIISPITYNSRRTYIKIIKALTSPLLAAYSKMQDIMTHLTPISPTSSSTTTIFSTPEEVPLPTNIRLILENTHIQLPPHITNSRLNHVDSIITFNQYSLSNAAFNYHIPEDTL